MNTQEQKRAELRKKIVWLINDASGAIYNRAATSGFFSVEEMKDAAKFRGGNLAIIFALLTEAAKLAGEI